MSFPLLLKRSQTAVLKRQVIYHIVFLIVWGFIIYTGAVGIDFGTHWDERKLFKSVASTIPVGKVLPGWYNYPSMIYDLTVLSASPEIISTHFSNRSGFRDIMEKWLPGKDLRLRTRMVFLFISTLSVLWTYLLIFHWTRQWMQALLGSAILASSWEFAYHARWIAPDAILMQFGILTVLCAFLAIRSSGRRRFVWLVAATVAAGLACGTKYFGGIFLVPVFIGGYKLLKDSSAKSKNYIVLFFVLATIFTLTFLLITPGALLDTARMIQDVRYEIHHYGSGDTGYTVHRGWQHLSLLFVYLFGVFFSKYWGISLLFSIFVFVGVYTLLKTNPKSLETWIFLSVPLLYIPYISLQEVMMVRNDLLLFPFLAILAAGGIVAAWNSKLIQANMVAKAVLIVGLVTTLLINYSWLYRAAQSIPARATTDRPRLLQNYLLTHKETTFYLSPKVRALVDSSKYPNVVNDPLLAEKYVYVFDEVDHPLANRPDLYDPIFGPYEVNLSYYPSWNEDTRIMVASMKTALSQSQFGLAAQ